jgi:Protein of unknown function (DUF3435)
LLYEVDDLIFNATLPIISLGILDNAGNFQAYINERVTLDVQAAFLGRPSADTLFKAASHMSRDINPRAPIQLADYEFAELNEYPLVAKLQERRHRLTIEAKKVYGSLKKAKEKRSLFYDLYQEAESALKNTKIKLRRGRLKESRTEYFKSIDTEDARRQLEIHALSVKVED